MAGGKSGFQTTLRASTSLSGVGVHTGRDASLTLHPAESGSGIHFVRSCSDGEDREVRADVRSVGATDLCITIGSGASSIATVEHLMAALRALEVDNVMVEVDGPEVPVMDGSAAQFVQAIEQAGLIRLAAPRRYIQVLRPVCTQIGDSHAEFLPHDGLRLEVEIDFDCPLIGRQSFASDIDPDTFRIELARARTFGFLSQVEDMWKRGFALGASLENAVVIGDDKVVNPEGLRFPNEFARHKALDAMGDLALAGAPILARYKSYRGSHKLNVRAVEELLAHDEAWTYSEQPVRRKTSHADLHAGIGVPAYGPDAS